MLKTGPSSISSISPVDRPKAEVFASIPPSVGLLLPNINYFEHLNSPTVVNSSLRSNFSIAAPESDPALLNRLKDEESSAMVPLEKSVKLHRTALCLIWSRICRNLNLGRIGSVYDGNLSDGKELALNILKPSEDATKEFCFRD
ncbi:hypothetical protein OPV22_007665 [Ensete ventricosum]|uniref:Uncharacterized protein n=1 Tax=Ensete ventricosum TaxID=4639 RepID=A0AAV8RUH0_ENSVE|nr:hypothetical protein OPV22_007665 [Ensete ventricosum]